MNDPGLDEPIKKNANKVEQRGEEDELKLEIEDEETFLDPRFAQSKYLHWLDTEILTLCLAGGGLRLLPFHF